MDVKSTLDESELGGGKDICAVIEESVAQSFRKKRKAARRKRALNKKIENEQKAMLPLDECKPCRCVGVGEVEDSHCTCCCSLVIQLLDVDRVMNISTEEQLRGIYGLEVTEDLPFETPELDVELKNEILALQEASPLVTLCKKN